MPSPLTVSGQTALQRVSQNLGTYTALVAKFLTEARGSDISSCNITAGFLGGIISANPLTAFTMPPGMAQTKRVAEIKRLLGMTKMVYVAISPDHHFILFSIDTDKMVILQAFQGVYNFNEWWKTRVQGVIATKVFLDAMTDLVSGNEAKVQVAARTLFSYRLASTNPVVEIEVFKYFAGKAVSINAIASKDI